jgi:hypothetical protein
MENQPGQQPSSPYSQYSPYPQYPSPTDPYASPPPPTDPYAQAPAQYPMPGQQPYPTPTQPPYQTQPGQQTYPPQPYPGQPYPYGAPGPNYPQPPRRKNYLWLIIVAAVLVVVVFGIVFASANSNKGSTGGTQATAQTSGATATATSAPTQAGQQPTATPTQPSSSSTSGSHKLGDVVTIDNWQVVVNNAKISHGGQYDTVQHTGDVFLEIDVSVTNQTGKSQTFSSLLNFTLKDSTGQTYDQSFVSDAPSSPDGTVANGSKLRGTVVYEVPPTMHSFEFDVAPDSFNSSDVATWNLSV